MPTQCKEPKLDIVFILKNDNKGFIMFCESLINK